MGISRRIVKNLPNPRVPAVSYSHAPISNPKRYQLKSALLALTPPPPYSSHTHFTPKPSFIPTQLGNVYVAPSPAVVLIGVTVGQV